jgi:hypothetical protein
MFAVQVNQEQRVITALILDTGPVLTGGPGPGQTARLGAYLMFLPELLRLWHPSKESLDRARRDLEQRAGAVLSEAQLRTDHGTFGDVVIEAMVFPMGTMTEEEVQRKITENAGRYFEETWAHRPLKSLSLIPPIDAAGSATLRKKLRGVIQFLQECAAPGPVSGYDFDRLRHKLGLTEDRPAAPAPAGEAPDFGRMSAADLAGVAIEGLTDDQLTQAWQAAQKLDAQELASGFARALVARPVRSEQPDRFAWYSFLSQRALDEGNTEAALNYVNEGERVDGEANESRRRNDYEQRRAQVHVKRGEADQAFDTFARLIERAPSELKYRGTAAEGMLALRQGERARRFAEEGLARARQQNDRDSEQYFLELMEAARKQGG